MKINKLLSLCAATVFVFASLFPLYGAARAISRDASLVTHYGDANMDGKINTADASVLLKHAAGVQNITDPVQFDFADANRDGLVNTADATFVLKVSAGMLSAIPVEGTQPTAEPTGNPTTEPTGEPTGEPTAEPTGEPTGEPTTEPTPTSTPTPTPTPDPTPDPTPTPTPTPDPSVVVITFLPGSDEENGGGIKKDGFMPDEQIITGEFGYLYKDKIPHSVTAVAGAKDAYAFTHWTDEEGNVYYPGDRIYTEEGETKYITLTANWDSGYTVLMDNDDIEQYVFEDLNAKVVLGCNIALYYYNSEYLFPIGFNQDSPWNQILYLGAFKGTFEGAGYTISNLTVLYEKTDIWSAFFYENKGTVSNLNFVVNQVSVSGNYAAAIACTNYGTIRNVNVTHGNRNNYYYENGYTDIISWHDVNDFEDFNFNEYVEDCPKVAGIAAKNCGTIVNCDVTELTLACFHGLVAGITGYNTEGALVENCRSTDCFCDMLYVTSYNYPIQNCEVNALISVNKGTMRDCIATGFQSMYQATQYNPFA